MGGHLIVRVDVFGSADAGEHDRLLFFVLHDGAMRFEHEESVGFDLHDFGGYACGEVICALIVSLALEVFLGLEGECRVR